MAAPPPLPLTLPPLTPPPLATHRTLEGDAHADIHARGRAASTPSTGHGRVQAQTAPVPVPVPPPARAAASARLRPSGRRSVKDPDIGITNAHRQGRHRAMASVPMLGQMLLAHAQPVPPARIARPAADAYSAQPRSRPSTTALLPIDGPLSARTTPAAGRRAVRRAASSSDAMTAPMHSRRLGSSGHGQMMLEEEKSGYIQTAMMAPMPDWLQSFTPLPSLPPVTFRADGSSMGLHTLPLHHSIHSSHSIPASPLPQPHRLMLSHASSPVVQQEPAQQHSWVPALWSGPGTPDGAAVWSTFPIVNPRLARLSTPTGGAGTAAVEEKETYGTPAVLTPRVHALPGVSPLFDIVARKNEAERTALFEYLRSTHSSLFQWPPASSPASTPAPSSPEDPSVLPSFVMVPFSDASLDRLLETGGGLESCVSLLRRLDADLSLALRRGALGRPIDLPHDAVQPMVAICAARPKPNFVNSPEELLEHVKATSEFLPAMRKGIQQWINTPECALFTSASNDPPQGQQGWQTLPEHASHIHVSQQQVDALADEAVSVGMSEADVWMLLARWGVQIKQGQRAPFHSFEELAAAARARMRREEPAAAVSSGDTPAERVQEQPTSAVQSPSAKPVDVQHPFSSSAPTNDYAVSSLAYARLLLFHFLRNDLPTSPGSAGTAPLPPGSGSGGGAALFGNAKDVSASVAQMDALIHATSALTLGEYRPADAPPTNSASQSLDRVDESRHPTHQQYPSASPSSSSAAASLASSRAYGSFLAARAIRVLRSLVLHGYTDFRTFDELILAAHVHTRKLREERVKVYNFLTSDMPPSHPATSSSSPRTISYPPPAPNAPLPPDTVRTLQQLTNSNASGRIGLFDAYYLEADRRERDRVAEDEARETKIRTNTHRFGATQQQQPQHPQHRSTASLSRNASSGPNSTWHKPMHAQQPQQPPQPHMQHLSTPRRAQRAPLSIDLSVHNVSTKSLRSKSLLHFPSTSSLASSRSTAIIAGPGLPPDPAATVLAPLRITPETVDALFGSFEPLLQPQTIPVAASSSDTALPSAPSALLAAATPSLNPLFEQSDEDDLLSNEAEEPWNSMDLTLLMQAFKKARPTTTEEKGKKERVPSYLEAHPLFRPMLEEAQRDIEKYKSSSQTGGGSGGDTSTVYVVRDSAQDAATADSPNPQLRHLADVVVQLHPLPSAHSDPNNEVPEAALHPAASSSSTTPTHHGEALLAAEASSAAQSHTASQAIVNECAAEQAQPSDPQSVSVTSPLLLSSSLRDSLAHASSSAADGASRSSRTGSLSSSVGDGDSCPTSPSGGQSADTAAPKLKPVVWQTMQLLRQQGKIHTKSSMPSGLPRLRSGPAGAGTGVGLAPFIANSGPVIPGGSIGSTKTLTILKELAAARRSFFSLSSLVDLVRSMRAERKWAKRTAQADKQKLLAAGVTIARPSGIPNHLIATHALGVRRKAKRAPPKRSSASFALSAARFQLLSAPHTQPVAPHGDAAAGQDDAGTQRPDDQDVDAGDSGKEAEADELGGDHALLSYAPIPPDDREWACSRLLSHLSTLFLFRPAADPASGDAGNSDDASAAVVDVHIHSEDVERLLDALLQGPSEGLQLAGQMAQQERQLLEQEMSNTEADSDTRAAVEAQLASLPPLSHALAPLLALLSGFDRADVSFPSMGNLVEHLTSGAWLQWLQEEEPEPEPAPAPAPA